MSEMLEQAYTRLDEIHPDRENKPAPMTSETHLDDWLQETGPYVEAALTRGNVENAKEIIDYWVDAQAEDGRVPHMIVNMDNKRRRHWDRRIQFAHEQQNGHVITPFTNVSTLSMSAERIAAAMPENEATEWLEKVVPALTKEKQWRYAERDVFDDGLPVQIHPDELLFRHSSTVGQVVATMPPNKLMRLQERLQGIEPAQRAIRGFRIAQGDDQRSQEQSTYDPDQFMKLDTAAGVYTALLVARQHGYRAWDLKDATNKHGEQNAFMLQDVANSALLIADNEALVRLYKRIGREVPSALQENIQKTRENFDKHWDPQTRTFVSRLPQRDELLPQMGGPESLLAFYANDALSNMQRTALLHQLGNHVSHGAEYIVPTNSGEMYQPDAIHRGAVDPTFNLLLSRGIEGFDSLDPLRRRIAVSTGKLAASQLFKRGYNAETGESLGQAWGPSAAAVVALAHK